MNNKSFVDWLRIFLENKIKLSKKDTVLLKQMLAGTYNELVVDAFFAQPQLPIPQKKTGGEFVPDQSEIWMDGTNLKVSRPFGQIVNSIENYKGPQF